MTQDLGVLEFLYQNFKKHFIMSGAFILNIIITAFVLSFSHCSFMCGGFNVILGRLCASLSKLSTLVMMLLYHAGRITAYACLGAVFGYFGAGVMRDASAKGLVFFGAGVLLVVLGVSLLLRGKMLAFFEIGTVLFSKKNRPHFEKRITSLSTPLIQLFSPLFHL